MTFLPPGFEQRAIATPLGVMAYATNLGTLPTPPSPIPLIFLHSLGGGSSAYEWSRFYPAFATEHPIIAPDLVGWGQSTHPQRTYFPEDYFTQFSALLDAFSNPPPVVFASSLTAGLLVRFAIQHPDRLRMLMLVCPSGYSDFGESYAQSLSAQLVRIPGLDQGIYSLGAANATAIRSFMERFLFAQPRRITDEMVAAYLASAQQPNATYSALASLRGDLCFDLTRYLPQLTVPTIMLWGENAWFSTLSRGQRLAALNPKAIQDFHMIPDAGVLPHLEVPAMAIAPVQAHLTRLHAA